MLWQDRNGTWHSTVSPIDIKINNAILDAKANGTYKEFDDSEGSLFDQMFGEFYADWLNLTSTLRLTSKRAILVSRYQTTENNELH